MAVLSVLRRTSGWLAMLVATTYVSGCCGMRPRPASYDPQLDSIEGQLSQSQPPPATSPPPQPPPPPLTGTYDEGEMDGEEAAGNTNVAGYVALGVITAPLVVLCLLGAAGGGGGGGGCGGNTDFGDSKRVSPPDAPARTPEYVDGYNSGYQARIGSRREGAFLGGLIGGLGILAIGVLILAIDAERRENLEGETGEHATAGGRRGAPLLRF